VYKSKNFGATKLKANYMGGGGSRTKNVEYHCTRPWGTEVAMSQRKSNYYTLDACHTILVGKPPETKYSLAT
jgi:hypothetical protein